MRKRTETNKDSNCQDSTTMVAPMCPAPYPSGAIRFNLAISRRGGRHHGGHHTEGGAMVEHGGRGLGRQLRYNGWGLGCAPSSLFGVTASVAATVIASTCRAVHIVPIPAGLVTPGREQQSRATIQGMKLHSRSPPPASGLVAAFAGRRAAHMPRGDGVTTCGTGVADRTPAPPEGVGLPSSESCHGPCFNYG